MATEADTTLVKLTGTVVKVANATDDMRGRQVKDKDLKHFGRVHDVFVDDRERKPRFLLVDHGGLLGIGDKKSFIPVDVIKATTSDDVFVDDAHDHICGAPAFDEERVNDRDYQSRVCGYYGCSPYWSSGYVYPHFNV
ncbi:PRC-barrel domain-containing protein [Mycobacterium intracellulare]|uniref:PRC-barrel domain-containing protein n=1 Tax=Mycobacterium intracellulare TaxID=1767 RepID=UPI0007EBD435|nr:PRC-barrel domain-containing protein [Mycobacterium intracellulare]OBH37640.1 PRC-barrel domain-containing protein [Mycobacterium intracellulare]